MLLKLGVKKVIIAARRLPELERVKRESDMPDKVFCCQIDLNKPKDVLETLK